MVPFTKMHGLGNDYVYIDCTREELENPNRLAEIVSKPHFGVGSDGLILICNSDVADFKMRMFNKDGTEGEMCGNGIRCVGKFVYEKGLTQKKDLSIETLGGIKLLGLQIEDERVVSVTVDMGEPVTEEEFTVTVQGNPFTVKPISIGNPHGVVLVEDVANFEIETYGPWLEHDPHFPERANIEFVQVLDNHTILMRVWERGCGETLACGTGSSASAVACILKGLVNREVTVKLLGGELLVRWDENTNHVFMTGPATTVFNGELEI